MVNFNLEPNKDRNSCDWCGEAHTLIIAVSGSEHPDLSTLVLSRKCLRKMIREAEKFLTLNPSGTD